MSSTLSPGKSCSSRPRSHSTATTSLARRRLRVRRSPSRHPCPVCRPENLHSKVLNSAADRWNLCHHFASRNHSPSANCNSRPSVTQTYQTWGPIHFRIITSNPKLQFWRSTKSMKELWAKWNKKCSGMTQKSTLAFDRWNPDCPCRKPSLLISTQLRN